MSRWALFGIWIAVQAVVLVAAIRGLWSIFANSDKAWAIFRAYDRLANVAANGNEYETISSRAYRAQTEGRRWGCILCRWLDKAETDHCKRSAGV